MPLTVKDDIAVKLCFTMHFSRLLCREDSLCSGRYEGSTKTNGLAVRTTSSLWVTEEGWINNPFSSEAQSGEHTNSLFYTSPCVCVGNPGIPCQTHSLSEKINIVKIAPCKEWKGVYVQRCKQGRGDVWTGCLHLLALWCLKCTQECRKQIPHKNTQQKSGV